MASTPPSPLGREAKPLLSAREREIVQFVVQGCRNKEVAVRLCIEEQTVKNHLRKIFSKLGVARRRELSAVC